MLGKDSDANNSPSQNDNTHSHSEYLKLAARAQSTGDARLALHLYLAAFERSLQDAQPPHNAVIKGLKEAWTLACKSKERSLAEHIFEKLEPYLSNDEITQYASTLQRLALDRLEDFGLSAEDLENMTEMISQDFFGLEPSSMFMRVEQSKEDKGIFSDMQRGLIRDRMQETTKDQTHITPQLTNTFMLPEGDEIEQDMPDEKHEEGVLSVSANASEITHGSNEEIAQPSSGHFDETLLDNITSAEGVPGLFEFSGFSQGNDNFTSKKEERLRYKDLVGYGRAIELMKTHGIGIKDDPAFTDFMDMLNKKHGLSRMSITDVYLFRSEVREDANQFMLATMGEINEPVIRMRMEENIQGMPMLCITTSSNKSSRLNAVRSAIDGGGVLMLEDIDLWALPLMDTNEDEFGGFFHAQLTRGAREAMNLIKSAIENPNTYVLMSSSKDADVDSFVYDVLPPITVIDIDAPNARERIDLWKNIMSEHPSLSEMNLKALVQYSARMSRFDIYMAAREAVEEAYRESLAAKKYIAVSFSALLEKIAAYQPLESREYLQIENAIIESFSQALDDDLERWRENDGHHTTQ